MARGDALLSFQQVLVMSKTHTTEEPSNPRTLHSEAIPPDVLAAKLETLKAELKDELGEAFRIQARLLLDEYTGLKPLMSVVEVAKTLNVSARTIENLIGQGKLRPLWVKGQRGFHPDAVMAYLRTCEQKPRSRKRREVR